MLAGNYVIQIIKYNNNIFQGYVRQFFNFYIMRNLFPKAKSLLIITSLIKTINHCKMQHFMQQKFSFIRKTKIKLVIGNKISLLKILMIGIIYVNSVPAYP